MNYFLFTVWPLDPNEKVSRQHLLLTMTTLSSVSSAPSTMLLPGPQLETMVQKCIARILPTSEDTCRQYMDDFYHQSRPETRTENSVQNSSLRNVPIASRATSSASSQQLPPSPELFQKLTAGTMSPSSLSKHTCVYLATGVDDRTRGKIHAVEFLKFSSLMHSRRSVQCENYNMTEVDVWLNSRPIVIEDSPIYLFKICNN